MAVTNWLIGGDPHQTALDACQPLVAGRVEAVEPSHGSRSGSPRALEVQMLLADRGQHRAPSIPDLLIAATAELARLTVLHVDKDFDLIAAITNQPIERLEVRARSTAAPDAPADAPATRTSELCYTPCVGWIAPARSSPVPLSRCQPHDEICSRVSNNSQRVRGRVGRVRIALKSRPPLVGVVRCAGAR
jgi:hypothetical protein